MFPTRIAMAAHVPLVFEAAVLPMPAPATLQRLTLTGKTVREVLDLLVAADPWYAWSDVNGVIVIRTLAAVTNTTDPLNAPVSNIVWDHVSVPQALNGMVALLSGAPAAPVPSETPFDEAVFSVAVPAGSVLDVLIESARAHGALLWSTPDTTQRADHSGLSVGVATFSGRGIGADVPPGQ